MLRLTLVLLPLLAAPAVRAQTLSADTVTFPVGYCTALPRPVFEHWDNDFGRYERWLTPEIRKTQVGMSFQHEGVQTWFCTPSANPHAQLDTATAIRNAAQLQGNWRAVAVRRVMHIDSVSFAEKRIYRSATMRPSNSPYTLLFADQKLQLTELGPGSGKARKTRNAKFALVNQRYLLAYGLFKAGGAVSQVGLDASGRLVLHSCAVTERKIPGRYQVYQTIISQTILERQ